MENQDQDTCLVHAWLDGDYIPAGKLRLTAGQAEFWYGNHFLEKGYALDPLRLPLTRKVFQSDRLQGALGALGDALPDSWGRYLIKRQYGQTLTDLDILTLDRSNERMGALRFSRSFETPPPPEAHTHEWMEHFETWLNDNSAPLPDHIEVGSSAGGAKPKCLVDYEERKWMAKFRAADDVLEKPFVEHGTLRLAEACGIPVPDSKVLQLPSGRYALLIERFDREKRTCVHYISGKTLCGVLNDDRGLVTNDTRSYLILADNIAKVSDSPGADRLDLFRRAAFNILVNNHDDHPKNHGMIRAIDGTWRLSKAFDLVAGEGDSRDMAMAVGPAGNRATLSNLLRGSPSFALKMDAARDEIAAMIGKLAGWRECFSEAGVPERTINDITWAIQEKADVPRD